MVYDFDPRTNRENLNSKSYPRRLLEDILTNKIVDSMSFGTASNYLTRSYGPNHRVIYEGVGRLLADLLVGTLDNLEDLGYTQLRAEFVATRLMYLIFPDEDSVPVGDTHEETISFLLQTYEALLQGATKKSVDEVLNDIAEGNAVVLSTIEGYIASIKSSILATTEYNTDGVFRTHRHFAFTDESGLGSTNKPIEYKWGEELHTHDIIDGVIQPHIDADGNSHSHEVYLGIPENIVRLQNNLRKVFTITKPAHIKTGEVASVIDEDTPILTQSKGDVFSPILGIDPAQTDGQIIENNTIDSSLPYYNQNAQYGLVGVSLGSLYQEDMRKAREGVYEPNNYGYVEGKTIRFWRTNIKVADNLVIGNQKLRVIEVSERIVPQDGVYSSTVDSNGESYTYKTIRDLKKGPHSHKRITSSNIEVINGTFLPENIGPPFFRGELTRSEVLNDGEPIDFNGSVYFCDLMSDNDDAELGNIQTSLGGHTIRLSYIEVKVDAQITLTGLQVVKNASSVWSTRDQVAYETVEFVNNPDPMWPALGLIYNYAINLPAYIVKDMLKTKDGLPVSIEDLTIKVNGVEVDYNYHTLSLEHTNTSEDANKTNPHLHVLRIYDTSHEVNVNYNPIAITGDTITLTYPKAKSELRRFRELNSIEMTLNATRPARKVSKSGRNGNGQNRIIETTSPISYVLNDPQPISPFTQEQKTATYSAGSSDLLNTQEQELNTTYTLNNFSLNQTATQEQVFKPATKTLTTSNPIVSFYELGFRPSYITSVVDSDGASYTFTLNKSHVLVDGLSEEKTLTVSGLSSNPFDSDLDWYKGGKLAEGQAFFKHTSTLDLGAFTESTPESYMTNPLGLATEILDTFPNIDPVYTYNNNVITGVDLHDHIFVSDSLIHVDQIRSIYSMVDTKTSGVEGELTFYEDVITGYEFKQYEDGRDAFPNEYNPHNPQDEWLYPDPSLYVLGPIITGSPQVNTIPTYLFFGYFMLMDMGQGNPATNDYYLSIYRLDNGVKKYQTLTTITDPNGEDALQLSGNLPEANGSPLAYRLQDNDNMLAGFEYNFDSTTAYANASFNHIPNETYYLEVYFEEVPQGMARFIGFFSKGSNTDVNLSDTFSALHGDPNQNEVTFLSGEGLNVTLTYQVTFTTNPGEIASFISSADPSPGATKESENVGATHGTGSTFSPPANNYPQTVFERSTSWKDIFYPYNPETNTGIFFISEESKVPRAEDGISDIAMSFAPVDVGSTITFGDSVSYSLLLTPALVTESLPSIEDDHYIKFNYDHVFLEDTISLPTASLEWLLNLIAVSESDIVPSANDSITVPTYQRYVPSSTVPSMSDAHTSRVPSLDLLGSSVSVEDDLLCSLAYLPISVSDTVDLITDSSTVSFSYDPLNISDEIPSLSAEAKAFISSFFLSDSMEGINDGVETSLSLTPVDETDEVPNINDTITVPVYQTLTFQDIVPIGSILDSLNASIQIYQDLSDTVSSASDGLTADFYFTPIYLSDNVTEITDIVATDLNYTPITLGPDTITFNASVVAFISSTTQTEEGVSVSDNATTSITYTIPSVMIAVKYGVHSDNDDELFSVYTGSMDTLVYPAIIDLQPDSSSRTAVGIQNGTPSAYPDITDERTVTSLGPNAYTNSNDDANIRIPLEYDTDYKIYSRTKWDDGGSTSDIAIAMKYGNSGSNPTGYLSGETYQDLFPTASGGSQDKYFIHSFNIKSSDNTINFNPDTTGAFFTFSNNSTVRLYMHFKYTNTNSTDNADIFKIREAETGANHSQPNGNNNVTTGWIEPDLHPTITGFTNTVVSGTFYYTNLPNFSVANTDNDAQCSWLLSIGTRYHFQLYVRDHNPDLEIFLEARTNDNGASWNTEYSSSDSLTYTELINQNDNSRVRTDHFFTIRRDGFIIWEQDPQT